MRFACALLLAICGCSDLSRYSTSANESWCGVVTDADFVKAGITAGTRLRVTLDANQLEGAPGYVWMDPLSDGTAISGVPLTASNAITNDPIGSLTFGQGRTVNAILVPRGVSNPPFVVLSLMENGGLEVRVMRAGSDPPHDVFGLFSMTKQPGTCGF